MQNTQYLHNFDYIYSLHEYHIIISIYNKSNFHDMNGIFLAITFTA